MEKALTILMILGWLSFCVPCGFGAPNSKHFRFKWVSLNTILSCVVLLCYDYTLLNILANNSLQVLTGSPDLSEHITYFQVYCGKGIADQIIRIGSILYCNKIIALIKSVMFLKSSMNINYYYFASEEQNQIQNEIQSETQDQKQNEKQEHKSPEKEKVTIASLFSNSGMYNYTKWFTLSVVSIAVTGLVGDVIVAFEQYTPSGGGGVTRVEKLNLVWMPTSHIALSIICFLVDLSTILSVQFSLIFTVVLGVSLIQLHDDFFRNLKHLTDTCEQNKVLKSLKCMGRDAVARNELINIFVELKECFELFSSVAGLYSLCIIFEATCSIIGGFGAMALQHRESNLMDTLTDFLTILCVARLGNFMQAKINQNREEFQDEIAELYQFDIKNDEVSQVIELALNWKWKLTACEVFEINHDLIPAIIATVMTVFIFMFQLKGSEMESNVGNGLDRNKTN